MFRITLIILATLLAGGAAYYIRQLPVRTDMKGLAQIIAGLGGFFMLFFVVIRFVNDFFWWAVPVAGFVCVISYAAQKLNDIGRLVGQEKAAQYKERRAMSEELDVIDWGDFEGLVTPDEEPQPRRFLDNFIIADEADLGPNQLELDRLDDFIFTSRHGYLVHDQDPDLAPCDVMTIRPGMSVADLINAAKAHECAKETATP